MLSTYRKKNTKGLYLSSIKHFLTCIYGGTPNKSVEECEKLAANFISECKSVRDWFKDLLAYAVYLGERPPKTANAYMSSARSFIEYGLDVELSGKQLRVLRTRLPKGKLAGTVDGDLNGERLRRILAHCDVKGTALFLFLASSGIRIGEALQLQLGDIDLNKEPVSVTVRGEYTKVGDAHHTFISSEAKEALSEWLKIRDDYLQSAEQKGRGLGVVKSVSDSRLFPFSTYVANSMLGLATKKTNLSDRDASTNRRKFHIHMLRKFFRSQMGLAGVPRDVIEAMIGHNGYLDDAYRRYSIEQLATEYTKGESFLLINTSAETQTKINSKLDKQKEEIDDLTRNMVRLMASNDELKQKAVSLETIFNKTFKIKPEELRLLLQEIDRLLHDARASSSKKREVN